jgi:hypothetical protein
VGPRRTRARRPATTGGGVRLNPTTGRHRLRHLCCRGAMPPSGRAPTALQTTALFVRVRGADPVAHYEKVLASFVGRGGPDRQFSYHTKLLARLQLHPATDFGRRVRSRLRRDRAPRCPPLEEWISSADVAMWIGPRAKISLRDASSETHAVGGRPWTRPATRTSATSRGGPENSPPPDTRPHSPPGNRSTTAAATWLCGTSASHARSPSCGSPCTSTTGGPWPCTRPAISVPSAETVRWMRSSVMALVPATRRRR